jgi:hypothetical protein
LVWCHQPLASIPVEEKNIIEVTWLQINKPIWPKNNIDVLLLIFHIINSVISLIGNCIKALIATKQKGNIEKALNAFMEISTNEVSYRSVEGNLILCKEGKVGIPLTGLTTAHFCVHPMSDLDFQRHVFFFFCVFSEYVWEVIVRFVDIGWIVDHHCLNFLFLSNLKFHPLCHTVFIFLKITHLNTESNKSKMVGFLECSYKKGGIPLIFFYQVKDLNVFPFDNDMK